MSRHLKSLDEEKPDQEARLNNVKFDFKKLLLEIAQHYNASDAEIKKLLSDNSWNLSFLRRKPSSLSEKVIAEVAEDPDVVFQKRLEEARKAFGQLKTIAASTQRDEKAIEPLLTQLPNHDRSWEPFAGSKTLDDLEKRLIQIHDTHASACLEFFQQEASLSNLNDLKSLTDIDFVYKDKPSCAAILRKCLTHLAASNIQQTALVSSRDSSNLFSSPRLALPPSLVH